VRTHGAVLDSETLANDMGVGDAPGLILASPFVSGSVIERPAAAVQSWLVRPAMVCFRVGLSEPLPWPGGR